MCLNEAHIEGEDTEACGKPTWLTGWSSSKGRSWHLKLTLLCCPLHDCLSQLGLLTRTQQTGWLKQQTFISHSSGGWNSKIKVPTDLVSGEALFLILRYPSSHSLLSWQRAEGRSHSLMTLHRRALLPFMRALLSCPKHLPKVPLPKTIVTLEIRVSTWILEGHKHSVHNNYIYHSFFAW